MPGQWKLWHDVRGRFFVACFVVVWQVYATSHGIGASRVFAMGNLERPQICHAAQNGEMSMADRIAQLRHIANASASAANALHAETDLHTLKDYELQAKYCAADERPTENYTRAAYTWVATYIDTVWGGMMPILMLFMGILISVGPPFSGESNESSTLTFSLPWSRGRWLKERAKMSAGLMLLLVAPAYFFSQAITNLPTIPVMSEWMSIQPISFADVLPALMCGAVGIALGISATMLTRNALVGAISAGIAAYVLIMFNIASLSPSLRLADVHFTLLEMNSGSGVFVALAVIVCAIGLSYVRLERTDF